jgi:hypothetical protein
VATDVAAAAFDRRLLQAHSDGNFGLRHLSLLPHGPQHLSDDNRIRTPLNRGTLILGNEFIENVGVILSHNLLSLLVLFVFLPSARSLTLAMIRRLHIGLGIPAKQGVPP